MFSIVGMMEKLFPKLAEKIQNIFIQRLQDKCFRNLLNSDWGFSPAPSIKYSIPVVSDTLICDGLATGAVRSVGGIKKFGPDGTSVVLLSHREKNTVNEENESEEILLEEVDAVIWCTGYKTEAWEILSDPALKNTLRKTVAWKESNISGDCELPRLYKNIFSLKHPHTLAFMGCVAFASPAFQLYDLASMALAQAWSDHGSALSSLPDKKEMERSVNDQHEWIIKELLFGSEGVGNEKKNVVRRVHSGWVNGSEWMKWANRIAGTGIEEYFGWESPKAWWFWITNLSFYHMLTSGVYSPHIYRLFETGRRKAWLGAREEIEKVNRLVPTRKMY